MKYLIIGAGSIGVRHGQVAQKQGHEVAYLTKRENGFEKNVKTFSDLNEALSQFRPETIFICNETAKHFKTLQEIRDTGYLGRVMVEKPLFSDNISMKDGDFKKNTNTFVGYNLRFHPALIRLRELIEKEKVIAVNCYVGQYLPTWRPSQDYKQSYSAQKSLGGGVLRDLSHELDYLLWLFGPWQRVTSHGGHLSNLEITSDDVFNILWTTPKGASINLHLNYLDRAHRRLLLVQTDNHTIKLDLKNFEIQIDNEVLKLNGNGSDTYEALHKNLSEGGNQLCTFDGGLKVLELIEATENANRKGIWIDRK